jgi:hypothetical protein
MTAPARPRIRENHPSTDLTAETPDRCSEFRIGVARSVLGRVWEWRKHKEDTEMARVSENPQAPQWVWPAVAAGVVAALMVQVLLTMLALGVGLLSVDVPTANAQPLTVSTAALLWWIFSGIFAAFIGGAVAGAYAPAPNDKVRVVHGLAAWAVASLIVIGASTLSSSALVSHMASPGYNVTQRVVAVNRPGAPQLTAQQAEQLRRAFAGMMLASMVGLLAGGLAASLGGWWSRDMADELGVPATRRIRSA